VNECFVDALEEDSNSLEINYIFKKERKYH
jgi:hypothetical protein